MRGFKILAIGLIVVAVMCSFYINLFGDGYLNKPEKAPLTGVVNPVVDLDFVSQSLLGAVETLSVSERKEFTASLTDDQKIYLFQLEAESN